MALGTSIRRNHFAEVRTASQVVITYGTQWVRTVVDRRSLLGYGGDERLGIRRLPKYRAT